MKIIFLPSLSNSYGGPVISTINLLEVIADRSTFLITANKSDFKLSNNLDSKIIIKNFINFLFSNNFIKFISTEKDSFIFINGCWNPYGICLIFLGIIFKKRIIIHPRGMLYPWSIKKNYFFKKIFINIIYKYSQKKIEKFLCSSSDEDYFIRKLFPNAKTILMPNYQKFESNKETKADNLFTRKLLFLSRIHEKKGINLLLEAWESYAPRDWELIICGPIDKAIKKEFLLKIKRLKKMKVSYIGKVPFEKRFNIFESCSIFILPSYQENFGNVILEALHSGMPVITTTKTPWLEIEKKVCGKIIKPSKNSILESFYWIESLNKKSIKEMSNNAIKFANEFNLDNFQHEINQIFNPSDYGNI